MDLKKIAVIGERRIALGFRVIGIKDIFIYEDPKALAKKLNELIKDKEFNLIIASDSIEKNLRDDELRYIETLLEPVVIFIPITGESNERESVKNLAKRILGIDISNLKNSNKSGIV